MTKTKGKLQNPLLIALIISILTLAFVLLFHDIALADVGNTFSGGGSSSRSYSSGGSSNYSSGRSGGSFFLFYMISSLPYPLNIITWAVLIILPVFYSKKHKGNHHSNNSQQGVNYQSTTVMPESVVVSKIKNTDPNFSKYQFKNFVKDVYIKVQDAWEAREWTTIRPFESNELFDTHSKQLNEYIQKNYTPHLDKQEIIDTALTDFEIDGNYEYITVKFCASLLDYTTNEKGAIIDGNPSKRVYREYKLVFKRVKGVKTKEEENTTSTTNCPNCGAPTHVTSSGMCEFCKSVITNGDYGWVLDEYKQWM